jgi:hypothetical protein
MIEHIVRSAQMRACVSIWSVALLATACTSATPEHGDSIEQEVAQPLSANVTVTSRWSNGYCASVRVRNTTSGTISGWSASLRLNAADVTTVWNADRTLTGPPNQRQLVATAQAHNAVLAPSAAADFGFCTTGVTGTGVPVVSGAFGFPIEDVPLGITAKLKMTSNWATGYCAEVLVTNTNAFKTFSWAVALDLADSSFSSAWSASASTTGKILTLRPVAHTAVLGAGASATVGFCATKTGNVYRPAIVSPAKDNVNRLDVAVYVLNRIATCFIGDPCPEGGEGCVGLRNDDAQGNQLVEAFTDATFQAVRTTDPRVATAAKHVCTELVMSPEERAEFLAQARLFQETVRTISRGDIELNLRFVEFDRLDMDESRWGGGVWVGPWNLAEFAVPRLDFEPDFNMVLVPIRDPVQQLHHDLGGCGGTYGADIGIGGAGWSWVPKTGSSFWFECGNEGVLTHEWLHQVHFAYHNLSAFQDLYGWSLPACGFHDPDPLKWFPDTHQCGADPDFMGCGGDCAGINEHIMGVHWDPDLAFVANHCDDGVQDFGETEIDSGGPCLGGLRGLGAPARPSSPEAMLPDYVNSLPER